MPRNKKIDVPPRRPVVIKIGGSLKAWVPQLVPILRASGRPILIVPGGGIFADSSREMAIDDNSAHWMAIAAMDQFGWFIAAQGIGTSHELQIPDRPVVFLPYCSLRRYDPLPHTWNVTSDSISAWIADFLGLELLLLKSVDGIIQERKLLNQISDPIETDVVDPFFIPIVLKKGVKTTIVNGTIPNRVGKFLQGKAVRCTCIGRTF